MPSIRDKKRYNPEDYTYDYNILSWPLQKYLEEKNVLAADVIRQMNMSGKDNLYRWIRAAESPLTVYKALVAVYGLSENFKESALKLRGVQRHPVRIPGRQIEKLAARFDEIYPASRFHVSKLPVRKVEERHITLVPLDKGTKPKLTSALVKTVASANAQNHAGMVALVKMLSSVKVERDGLQIQLIDYTNQLAERDAKIQTLESELDEAKRMLDEALSTPQLTPEAKADKELQELTDIIKATDSGLLVELDKLRPKSTGLGA